MIASFWRPSHGTSQAWDPREPARRIRRDARTSDTQIETLKVVLKELSETLNSEKANRARLESKCGGGRAGADRPACRDRCDSPAAIYRLRGWLLQWPTLVSIYRESQRSLSYDLAHSTDSDLRDRRGLTPRRPP
mgnify:CR=1 FL=1